MHNVIFFFGLFATTAMADYSVVVSSYKRADVMDGTTLVRSLVCQSGPRKDGAYHVSCPLNLNKDAEFESVLEYDSSEDQWGSAPLTGFLALPGQPKIDFGCSAAGTGLNRPPNFQDFFCTPDGPVQDKLSNHL